MHSTTTAPVASRTWRALGVQVDVLVTDPGALDLAVALLEADLSALDLACSRFRPDSEVSLLAASGGTPMAISPLLTQAVSVALDAAAATDGDVDPTLGGQIAALGYDRDLADVPADVPVPRGARVSARRLATWRDVELDREARVIRVPDGVRLDLGATAKAYAADLAAGRIADATGCGILVNLGGDLSIVGEAPAEGWAVRVQDRPDGSPVLPAVQNQTVSLQVGGLATSSVTARRWMRGGEPMHHVLDPRTGLPVRPVWRTVSVAAPSCLEANVVSTAAVIRGERAPELLAEWKFPARLVRVDGTVSTCYGWPEDES